MKRFSFLLIIVVLSSCTRDWKNPLENDPELVQPVIEQIVRNAASNIEIYLNVGYSQEANITVERKTIGGFDPIGFVRVTQSTLMDTSFDKEFDHNFTYRVRVEKNGYRTDYSAEKPFLYPSTTINSPQGLHATILELQGVKLEWIDRSRKETGFKIEKDAGSGFVEIATLDSNVVSYTDHIGGIPPLPLKLSYQVKAFNSTLSSQWTPPISIDYSGIAAPTDLQVTDSASYHFTIEWKDNSSIETGYVVERNKNGGMFEEIAQLPAGTTRYIDTITEIGVFGYQVRAKKDNLSSPYSNKVSHNIKTIGLVACYPFNGNANDECGNGNHGTLIGATANRVLLIRDNGEDRMMLPHTILNGLRDFSVSARIKINTFHIGQNFWNVLLTGASLTDDNALFLGVNAQSNQWAIDINSSDSHFAEDIRVFDNKWHHIAVSRTGLLSRLYIDGIQVGAGITVPNAALDIANGGLVVGQEQDAVGGAFDRNQSFAGEVDNLRFYNRALTETEIQILFQESGWGN